jgi:hypothetical protein
VGAALSGIKQERRKGETNMNNAKLKLELPTAAVKADTHKENRRWASP